MSRKGHYLGGSTTFRDWSSWTGKGADPSEASATEKTNAPTIEMLRKRIAHLKKFGTREQVKAAKEALKTAMSRDEE